MNEFDRIFYRDSELNGLAGLDDFRDKLAKLSLKIHAIHDKGPIGRYTGRLRDKLKTSELGKKLTPIVVGVIAGPIFGGLAAKGVVNMRAAQERVKAREANKAFLKSPAGREYLKNKQKFDKAIKEMQRSPQYKEAYKNMKKVGYTDDEIAISFLRSKPFQAEVKEMVTDTIKPIVSQQLAAENIPPKEREIIVNSVSANLASESVDAATSQFKPALGIKEMLPYVGIGLMALKFLV